MQTVIPEGKLKFEADGKLLLDIWEGAIFIRLLSKRDLIFHEIDKEGYGIFDMNGDFVASYATYSEAKERVLVDGGIPRWMC